MTSYGGGRNANPGGPGGKRQKIQTNAPRGRTSHQSGGGGKKPNSCCPMVAAVHALERGQFRLARRYAVMSVRVLAARVA